MLFRIAKHHERSVGLPILLNELGLTGQAVEIGTHTGVYAEALLKRWKGERLHCIDPYIHYDDGDPASIGDRENDFSTACYRLRGYVGSGRCVFHRRLSSEMAGLFDDGSLDFVYVDGNHRYPYVLQDLHYWWPKLRSGGIIAGHDYICPCEPNDGWGVEVQPAVHKFCEAHSIEYLYILPELHGSPWGYYCIKP